MLAIQNTTVISRAGFSGTPGVAGTYYYNPLVRRNESESSGKGATGKEDDDDEKSNAEILSKCKAKKDNQLQTQLLECYYVGQFDRDHYDNFEACYDADCTDEDDLCSDRCYYKQIGLSKEQILDKFMMKRIMKYCKDEEEAAACYAEIIGVTEDKADQATYCYRNNCTDAKTFYELTTCNMQCQEDLLVKLRTRDLNNLYQGRGAQYYDEQSTAHASTPTTLAKVTVMLFALSAIACLSH